LEQQQQQFNPLSVDLAQGLQLLQPLQHRQLLEDLALEQQQQHPH